MYILGLESSCDETSAAVVRMEKDGESAGGGRKALWIFLISLWFLNLLMLPLVLTAFYKLSA